MKNLIATALVVGLLAACAPKNGAVIHFDIPSKDPVKLGKFYNQLYGWEIEDTENKEMPYWEADTGRCMFKGGINGGIYPLAEGEENLGTSIYAYVDDIDAALARVEELGGTVAYPKTPIVDLGFFAHIRDPEGNLTGLFQYDPKGGRAAFDAAKAAEAGDATAAPEEAAE